MKIAIVDDDAHDRTDARTELMKYLQLYCPELVETTQFNEYSSAEEFLDDYEVGLFSLVFLDIYMGALSGMDAARRIREDDPDCCIIFLTTSTEHAIEGYSVYPVGYILKPLSHHAAELAKIMEHCLPRMLAKQQQITLQIDKAQLAVPFRKIMYIECGRRRITLLHLSDQVLETRTPFETVYTELQTAPRFLECYHRLLVNMNFIASMEDNGFRLKNGELMPISRRRRIEAARQFMNYLLDK